MKESEGIELLISEITGSVIDYPVPHQKKKMSWSLLTLPTYLLSIMVSIYYTNTTSNQITGIYWPHTETLYHNKPSHMCHQMAFKML